MEQEVVHYYNPVSGKSACGAEPKPDYARSFSVFPERVNCAECLKLLDEGKSEVK